MKKIATWLLIVFIVFAVATKMIFRNIPQESTVIHGDNLVMLFHAKVRCPTCNTMESLVKETLNDQKYADLGINLVLLEYDSPENKELVERFHIGTASIILVEQRGEVIVRSCDVTSEAWHWIDYKKRFVEMLDTKLTDFFQEGEIAIPDNANHKNHGKG
jgi:hypothetical protein